MRRNSAFRVWPLRLITISVTVIVATLALAPFSKLFILVAVGLGMLDSLSTLEQLTGGREIYWISIPLLIAGDLFLKSLLFGDTTIVESVALYFQFCAFIVLTESVVVFLLRFRLETFAARRALK
jgi:hypothetical protein